MYVFSVKQSSIVKCNQSQPDKILLQQPKHDKVSSEEGQGCVAKKSFLKLRKRWKKKYGNYQEKR